MVSGDSARHRARDRVGYLTLHAQSEADWIDDALAEALAEAEDWPDVRVPLLNTLVVRALFLAEDPTDRLDVLEAEAKRHQMTAMRALAMIRRVDKDVSEGITTMPLESLAEARVLLDDDQQPVRDRLSALIALASTYASLQLHDPADEAMRDALEVVELLDEPEEGRAVCQFNRAVNTVAEVLHAVEAGADDDARMAHGRFESIVRRADLAPLPDLCSAEAEGYRQLCASAVERTWLRPSEAAALLRDIDDVCELQTLLQLVVPVADWAREPDLSEVLPPKDTAARFLYARALEAADGVDPCARAHRDHARELAARAWTARRTAAESLVALIDARRAARRRDALRRETLTDALTGVANRRGFDELTARLAGETVTVLTVDLDDFKRVNDRWGHHVGDSVLERVARTLSGVVGYDARTWDLATDASVDDDVTVARLGGDEFTVLVPGGDDALARRLAAAIEDAVAHLDWSDLLGDDTQSVSVGTASGACSADLFMRSDRSMYEHKRASLAHRLG